MTKTISVKQLRMNFPEIRKELKQGIMFTVIYRSSPIAVLSPIETYSHPFGDNNDKINDKKYDLPKDFKDFLDNIDKFAFKGGKPFNAVKLIRKDRGYDD